MPAAHETPIRCVIVDDEELARGIVREYLGTHADVKILAECANGFDAVKTMMEMKPDLVFLDVQMPKLSGFEVLELIDLHCSVIFTTAYDQYAVKAFEVHAVDYLLKPFSIERFDAALARAREAITAKREADLTPLISESRARNTPIERILIRDGSRVHVLPVDTVDFVEAQDDYISIQAAGKRHLKQERIGYLQDFLDPVRFVRIHRSFILNIDRISRIELYAKDSRIVILIDGTKLPVSRTGYERLRELLS